MRHHWHIALNGQLVGLLRRRQILLLLMIGKRVFVVFLRHAMPTRARQDVATIRESLG